MIETSPHPARKLALAEPPGPAMAAPWIGPMVALGARVARLSGDLGGQQLVVAISVPRRDFAALLVGTGWVMNRPPPKLDPPMDVLRKLEAGTPVRVVTATDVLADRFLRLTGEGNATRVALGRSTWFADKLRAVSVLPELETPVRMPRPTVGAVGRLARLDMDWDARVASRGADLAIVGTLAWLREELGADLSVEDHPNGTPSPISDLLLPDGKNVATWWTRLYAGASFAERLPLPDRFQAAVLDGAGAIKYLAELEVPVVVCVIDRSVADETAAEQVVQLRNSRGEPLSLRERLGWSPPAGVEALAFTVPL